MTTTPSRLRVCSTCCDNLAEDGKLECRHCDASRRFRNALGERLYAMSGMQPRITEVPPDRKPASAIDVALRRLMVVAGAVLLIVFTVGWLLGRFCK